MDIGDEVIKNIENLITKDEIKVVAIDGPGGAGKTTLAKELKDRLEDQGHKCVVLHIDDFITPRSVRYNDSFEEWYCHYVFQWRYNYLVEKILKPAKLNEEINTEIEFYEKHEDTYRVENVRIKRGTIIILEGIFLQRSELRDYLDYIIYIDVPREEVIKRVLKRDSYIGSEEEILHKYNRRYFPSEDRYDKTVEPKKRADLVIENKTA